MFKLLAVTQNRVVCGAKSRSFMFENSPAEALVLTTGRELTAHTWRIYYNCTEQQMTLHGLAA